MTQRAKKMLPVEVDHIKLVGSFFEDHFFFRLQSTHARIERDDVLLIAPAHTQVNY